MVIYNMVLDALHLSHDGCVGLRPLPVEGVVSMVQLTGGPCREVVQGVLPEEKPQKCSYAFSRFFLR